MQSPAQLSIEQEFSLRAFADQVAQMSHEQAQEFLISLYEQMMVREKMYQEFLKYEWGLESDSAWS